METHSLHYIFVVLGSPEPDSAFLLGSLQGWAGVKDHLHWPASNTRPGTAQDPVGLLWADCWLVCYSVSSRTPGSSSAKPTSPTAHTDAWDYSSPRCRTLHFSFLNFMRSLYLYFPTLPVSLCMAAELSDVLTTPSILVQSVNVLRRHFVPSPRPLLKVLNGPGLASILGHAACGWCPAGCHAAALHNPLSPVQSLFSVPHCLYSISLPVRLLWGKVLKALLKIKIHNICFPLICRAFPLSSHHRRLSGQSVLFPLRLSMLSASNHLLSLTDGFVSSPS